MLETDLAAKEAKIASGKPVAVKAIKRGLARWVCPAKIALVLSSSQRLQAGLKRRLGFVLVSSLGYYITCSFAGDQNIYAYPSL